MEITSFAVQFTLIGVSLPLFYIRLLKYVTNGLICLSSLIAAFEKTARFKITGCDF